MSLTKPQLEFMEDAAHDGADAFGASQHRMARALCDKGMLRAAGASLFRLTDAGRSELLARGILQRWLPLVRVGEEDVRKIPPDVKPLVDVCPTCDGDTTEGCSECDGAGTVSCGSPCCNEDHKCHKCKGKSVTSCGECNGSGVSEAAREAIAAEATRLWHRDIGRGVTTGTKGVYIAFAFESLREGRKAA